jgi:hypothetical protein
MDLADLDEAAETDPDEEDRLEGAGHTSTRWGLADSATTVTASYEPRYSDELQDPRSANHPGNGRSGSSSPSPMWLTGPAISGKSGPPALGLQEMDILLLCLHRGNIRSLCKLHVRI